MVEADEFARRFAPNRVREFGGFLAALHKEVNGKDRRRTGYKRQEENSLYAAHG